MLQSHHDGVERRTRILDAAERCFVRTGFHRATMQDVAAEAGMSAGNLYRYFKSKDVIVEGLCERDRRELAADFASFDGTADFLGTFFALARKHFEDDSRDKAVLCLQIWAEATRSDVVGRLAAEFERDVTVRLAILLNSAQSSGQIPSTTDPRVLARLICTLADGLFVRRAIVPDFDAAREVAPVLDLIGALIQGALPDICASVVSETAT